MAAIALQGHVSSSQKSDDIIFRIYSNNENRKKLGTGGVTKIEELYSWTFDEKLQQERPGVFVSLYSSDDSSKKFLALAELYKEHGYFMIDFRANLDVLMEYSSENKTNFNVDKLADLLFSIV